MCAELISLAKCALRKESGQTVAFHQGRYIEAKRFHEDVSSKAAVLARQQARNYAVFYESAYPFAVSLFALLHAGKHPWVSGNNRPGTAEKLIQEGCQLLGDWPEKINSDDDSQFNTSGSGGNVQTLDLDSARLTLFTSGSSGRPKAVRKTLRQLQAEIDVLELHWGTQLENTRILATVSHQHIYGLLFRLLWPLASGRCFHSHLYLSPEPLLKAASEAASCWVASPAQLKRLDDLSPWSAIKQLRAVFSSGGVLTSATVDRIQRSCGQQVIEIYGSTETGGIGRRIQTENSRWVPLNRVRLKQADKGRILLESPWTDPVSPCLLDDKIELQEDGRFALLGRFDRIVKVEEKRLSLDELEQQLNQSEWIERSHAFLLAGNRDRIGAGLELSPAGKEFLSQQGRRMMIRRLRKQLMNVFETVVVPRKWLLLQSIPLSINGKNNTGLLTGLLALDSTRHPQILFCDLQQDAVELELKIHAGLIYFQGHFPGQPILPGVAQLAWVERYGRLFFNIVSPFFRMEVIKFKKIIQPGVVVNLKLNWKAETGKLYFDLSSDSDSHSSGRILYQEHP